MDELTSSDAGDGGGEEVDECECLLLANQGEIGIVF